MQIWVKQENTLIGKRENLNKKSINMNEKSKDLSKNRKSEKRESMNPVSVPAQVTAPVIVP
ncbi:hypothetical protein HK096_011434, partial [Nowakowskiella sp. JEL0078]